MLDKRVMKLTVVGSAPAYTRRSGHPSSCYLVEHAGTAVVLDFGQGAFSELWRYRSPGDVSAVVISHLHADHNVDLIPLRHWVRFENRGYGPALFAPADLRGRIGQYQSDPDFLSDLRGESLGRRPFSIGNLRIEPTPVTHIPDSYAFRVSTADGGPGLVYSGDCGVWQDLVPLIRRGDTLLSEAAFGTRPDTPGIHLTGAEAGRAAAEGGAARLLLTHLLDRIDRPATLASARDVFGAAVEIAEPGLIFDIR